VSEKVIFNETRPGIELIEMKGGPGYDDEQIVVSNGLANGLRIEIANEDTDWACFHIRSKGTALLIAAKLTEWCERMANPEDK
jgi:hypothetical protein